MVTGRETEAGGKCIQVTLPTQTHTWDLIHDSALNIQPSPAVAPPQKLVRP
jgi:hypothetical protein